MCEHEFGQQQNRIFLLLPLLLPLSEYMRLFRPLEGNIIESGNNEKLNKIYGEIVSMKPPDPLTVPPLSSRTAIAMQRTLVTHMFREVLAIKLEPYEADVLQHFSGVSLALIHFLEFCGCPGEKTDLMPLEVKLELFVMYAEGQLYKSGELDEIRKHHEKLRLLVGLKRSIWLRIRNHFFRRHFRNEDNINQTFLKKQQSRYYGLLDKSANDAILKFNEIRQRSTHIILAFKIHLRAMKLLTRIASDQQETNDESFFRNTLDSLKSNLKFTN